MSEFQILKKLSKICNKIVLFRASLFNNFRSC